MSKEITERKQTEVELIEAKEKVEYADNLKSEFLAQISHEIRSPINVISNYISLIKETPHNVKDETLLVSFNAIEYTNKRIIRTIDMIINVSEVQLGTYQPVIDKIDLKADLENVCLQYENVADRKKLNLDFNSLIDSALIEGNRYSITQIFANLIDNSIKYTASGSITVSMIDEKDSILIKIEDPGIGISEEYLPKLFDSFSQEDHGYTRKFDGNGVGLALVKKFCELNNASITVESKKEVGKQFFVRFNKIFRDEVVKIDK